MPDHDEKGKFAKGNQVGKQNRWKKNQSGNPNGTRGAKNKFSYWLDKFFGMTEEGFKEYKKRPNLTQGAKAAIRFIEIMCQGSIEHAKEYMNRVEGPVRKEITGLHGSPLMGGGRPNLSNLGTEDLAALKEILAKAGIEEEDEDDDPDA